MNKIQQIQTILGVKADGIWGSKTQAALNKEIKGNKKWPNVASSFADPKDVEAFKRCKATGKTDKQCFAVGDNGIGQFGKITAQEHTPMCALHGEDMIAKWGSIKAAAHKKVKVFVGGKSVICAVEDRMSSPKASIDLNPAAAKMLGLKPPFMEEATWEWL